MKIQQFILIILIFLVNTISSFGQLEKIKGNKIVTTELRTLEGFHSIIIHKNLDITLNESNLYSAEIEADENLIALITTTVKDSILTIDTTKDIKSSKKTALTISYATALQRIISNDKTELHATNAIQSPYLWLETNDNTETFLTLNTDTCTNIITGKSDTTLHISRGNAVFKIHDTADLNSTITADTLNLDISLKATAKLEGNLHKMTVHAANSSKVFGEKLTVRHTELTAKDTSDCFLLTNDTLHINAKNDAKVYVLGTAKIYLDTFSDKAILYKKPLDYTPSKLKLY